MILIIYDRSNQVENTKGQGKTDSCSRQQSVDACNELSLCLENRDKSQEKELHREHSAVGVSPRPRNKLFLQSVARQIFVCVEELMPG